MDDNEHKINSILNSRLIPEPSKNLANRIVHQASLQKTNNVVSTSYLGRLKELFVLNYPALSSIACLVIGLYMGVLTESDASASVSGLNEWLSFTSLDEEGYL